MGEANFYYFTCLKILAPWLKPFNKSFIEITLDRK